MYVKWNYNMEMEEYENKILMIDDLDNSLMFGQALVIPKM